MKVVASFRGILQESWGIHFVVVPGFGSDKGYLMSHGVAVIVPCYRTRSQILPLIASIGEEVDWIIVVDDACPEQTGQYVRENCSDSRVRILTNATNQGVGGAVLNGYSYAYDLGADILVKLDGDGQMNPRWIKYLIRPIEDGRADYTKGNRFFNIEGLRSMPRVRLLGNAILSFLEKISSGYWMIFDPTNGFTAISASTFALLPVEKISRRYFFESDMLFHLGTFRACVLDVPMEAYYGDERSNLKISLILHEFLSKHVANACKRIGYNYFLRDFSLASVELVVGIFFILFGTAFGAYRWFESIRSGITASTGTVMLSALPIILGVQLLISFLSFDIGATPSMAPVVCM
jgi:glycosyltransferase involved in cell wall biosynthesis